MSTNKKIKFKLKPGIVKILKVIGIVLIVILILFIFYRSNINALKKIGYSEKASKNIIFKFKKKEVINLGKNKTLNKAFESDDYIEKNFTSYSKIKYQNQENLIKNINKLLKVGYSNDEISLILSRGTDKDVSDFAKREKVKYLEEFFSVSYSKLKNYDRYVSYMDISREDEETSVLYVNLDLDKDNYNNPKKVNEFSYTMLVNKHHVLDKKFVPQNLKTVSTEYASDKGVKANNTAIAQAKKMIDAAKKEDKNIIINSAYRSYEDQEEVVNTYQELYGDEYIEKYVLKPGFSEHQTGLGIDFGSTDTKIFIQSDEYKWMEENCYKYGFIHRFKSSYEDITGIKSEAWHYRYVGKKAAKYMYENDMSLEEYYIKFIEK